MSFLAKICMRWKILFSSIDIWSGVWLFWTFWMFRWTLGIKMSTVVSGTIYAVIFSNALNYCRIGSNCAYVLSPSTFSVSQCWKPRPRFFTYSKVPWKVQSAKGEVGNNELLRYIGLQKSQTRLCHLLFEELGLILISVKLSCSFCRCSACRRSCGIAKKAWARVRLPL